jgi:hypothetical protein
MSDVSPLNMSDEDFLHMDLPEYIEEDTEASAQAEEAEVSEEDNDEDLEDEEDSDTSEDETNDENTDDVDSGSEEEEGVTTEEEEAEDSTEEVEQDSKDEVDYKKAYEELTKPFKANGKEIKVESIDEAITLMKMGANYNKKMAALKPNLKILKMLENNSLLDESKLSYLIDLEKKDPKAINKLIKDSGIDPLDVDVDNEVDYTPKSYGVSDNQIELDSILEELRESDGYHKTIDIIGNKWDKESRETILSNPSLIKVINNHVEAKIYDEVIAQVDKRRMLGQLQGMSDIEAYKLVGDEIFLNPANQQPVKPVVKKPVVTKQIKVDPTVKSKKLAASPTKSGKPVKSDNDDLNPLAMSDEDFEKFIAGKY